MSFDDKDFVPLYRGTNIECIDLAIALMEKMQSKHLQFTMEHVKDKEFGLYYILSSLRGTKEELRRVLLLRKLVKKIVGGKIDNSGLR
jgi:hypothetical protein